MDLCGHLHVRFPLKILRMVLLSLFLALAMAAVAMLLYFRYAPIIGSKPSGERLARIQASANYRDGKFHNVVETNMDMSLGTMVKVMWKIARGGEGREPKDTIPTVAFDPETWAAIPDTAIATAWFGHSSVLIKVDGVTFLCDPVFGERASTFSFMGPKRFNYQQHMSVDLLPKVDVVLLSHDHYDHLDHVTVLRLKDQVKRWVAPLGVGAHLEHWGVPAERISEHDRWEGTVVEGVHLTLAPSRHFSGRSLTDRSSTLWGAWIIEGRTKRVYFGADSGYSSTFKEVGGRFGPFDLVLLECGAYNELWSNIHMMPEETAQAALDLRAKVLMPIHWAKFSLAMHPWKEPVERVSKKASELNVQLLIPRIGRIVNGPDMALSERWWDGLE